MHMIQKIYFHKTHFPLICKHVPCREICFKALWVVSGTVCIELDHFLDMPDSQFVEVLDYRARFHCK